MDSAIAPRGAYTDHMQPITQIRAGVSEQDSARQDAVERRLSTEERGVRIARRSVNLTPPLSTLYRGRGRRTAVFVRSWGGEVGGGSSAIFTATLVRTDRGGLFRVVLSRSRERVREGANNQTNR